MYTELRNLKLILLRHPLNRLTLLCLLSLFSSGYLHADQIKLKTRIVIGKIVSIDSEGATITDGCGTNTTLSFAYHDILEIALTSSCDDEVKVGHGSVSGACESDNIFVFVINFKDGKSVLAESIKLSGRETGISFNGDHYSGDKEHIKSILPKFTCTSNKQYKRMKEYSQMNSNYTKKS